MPATGRLQHSKAWSSFRGSILNRARGRVGKATPYSHRNRTLVLKNTASPSTNTQEHQVQLAGADSALVQSFEGEDSQPSPGLTSWVTKRDRHMQLINSSIFDKESEARKKAIERTRLQKTLERDRREKQKLNKHLQSLDAHPGRLSLPSSLFPAVNELTINGLRFKVSDSGNKLLRMLSAWNST